MGVFLEEIAKEILDNVGLVEVTNVIVMNKADIWNDPLRVERTTVAVEFIKNGEKYIYNSSKFKNLYELDGIQAKELNEAILNEFGIKLDIISGIQRKTMKAKRQKRWR